MKEKEKVPLIEKVFVFRAEISRVYPLEEYYDIERESGRAKKTMIEYHMKTQLIEKIKDLIFTNKLEDKIYSHERVIK